jgi:hypothetical protein
LWIEAVQPGHGEYPPRAIGYHVARGR